VLAGRALATAPHRSAAGAPAGDRGRRRHRAACAARSAAVLIRVPSAARPWSRPAGGDGRLCRPSRDASPSRYCRRQENFFKYLRDEYALDALVDYQLEPADPQRDVPNPAWNKVDARLRLARTEVIKLTARYGIEALVNREAKRPTMRVMTTGSGTIVEPVSAVCRAAIRSARPRSVSSHSTSIGACVVRTKRLMAASSSSVGGAPSR
jgi:hypothetical protein